MPIFALITPDLTDTGRRKSFDAPPPRPAVLSKPYYVPFIRQAVGSGPVVGSVVVNVAADSVTEVTTRRAMTAQEQDDRDAAAVAGQFDGEGVSRALARVLFNHENRLRVIESQPSVTAQQFKDALKGLIR